MSRPLLLIIGAGPRVGVATSDHFLAKGWEVALASRSLSNTRASSSAEPHTFNFDASKPKDVEELFKAVRTVTGTSPTALVYNAYNFPSFVKDEPTSLSLEQMEASISTNWLSFYASVQQAVSGFTSLPASPHPKTIMFTGNALYRWQRFPDYLRWFNLAHGKASSAQYIAAASDSLAAQEINIYFVDERMPDGTPMYQGVSGPAHAQYFYELATDPMNRPWEQTFAEGKGYIDFEGK